MKITSALPRWNFNPVQPVTHNVVRWPRGLHQLAHTLVGVVPTLVLWHFHFAPWMIAIVLFIIATYIKFTWIDTTNKKFYPWIVPPQIEGWDFIGDLIMVELLLIALVFGWWVIPVWYVASVISGPNNP